MPTRKTKTSRRPKAPRKRGGILNIPQGTRGGILPAIALPLLGAIAPALIGPIMKKILGQGVRRRRR